MAHAPAPLPSGGGVPQCAAPGRYAPWAQRCRQCNSNVPVPPRIGLSAVLLGAGRVSQLAVRRIFQVVPFQSSASGARTPLTVRWPTAMQNVLTQETLLSLDPRPADSGRAGRNAWPFHAKNPPRPAVMHLVLLAQDKVSGRKQAPPHLL